MVHLSTPVYKIWKKSAICIMFFRANSRTDGRTDGRTDSAIPYKICEKQKFAILAKPGTYVK